jgi:serine/threonine protein kinase
MSDQSDIEGSEAYTPAYAAPEHHRGNRGTAADIFSVGCVAYEIITGW